MASIVSEKPLKPRNFFSFSYFNSNMAAPSDEYLVFCKHDP